MTQVQEITALVDELGDLRSVLDDLNVKFVTIAANGFWSFEKLGRTRHGAEPLPTHLVRQLADRIPAGRHARSGEWALRKYQGVAGAAILIERLPMAVADRLPQEVLSTLKRQVKTQSNGLLVGQPGAGKGALLLWLALQIPDQPVLYVAENPPSEFPGNHIMHVYPPSSPQERRALERFVRLSPTVMWDRVASASDLLTLFGFPGARRRWFTLDASSVRSALQMLTGATSNGCDARFSTMLALASSVIGRPEAHNLLVRADDGWQEEFVEGESCLDLLDAYDSSDIRRLGPTEVSTPGTHIGQLGKVEVSEDFAREAESFEAPVMTEGPAEDDVTDERVDEVDEVEEVDEVDEVDEVGEVGEFDGPGDRAAGAGLSETTSADHERPEQEPSAAAAAAADNPRTIPVDLEEADLDDPEDAITGMLPREEIRELREQREARRTDEQEAQEPEHVPDRRLQAPPGVSKNVPEVTRAYVDTPEEVAEESQSDYLNDVVGDIDEEEPVPAVNLNDLRITTIEKVDEADLELIEELREAEAVHDDDDYDEFEDYSGVFEGDLDFDHLAEEMLSEISEVDAELIEDSHPGFGETNPNQQIIISEDDLELLDPDETSDAKDDATISAKADILDIAKAMSDASRDPAETGESTKEFTLNERLLKLRRQQNDD